MSLAKLELHSGIAEELDTLAELQGDVQSPEDQAYLDGVGHELDIAKQDLALGRRTGTVVLTSDGIVEKQDLENMRQNGTYTHDGAYGNGRRA